ncbi:MAG: peptidoglycan-binding protein [Pseudomonadota bacterium]
MIAILRSTLGAFGLWLVAAAPLAAAPQDSVDDSFRLFASELVVDLDRVAATRPETLTIAVWPHPVGPSPVPASLAQEYNDRLLAALLETGGQRHRFVARDSLSAVVDDLAESSDLDDNLDQVLAALSERAQADVLVVCKLRALGPESLQISYRAVDVRDGTVLAATSHRRLALLPDEVGAAARALSLEQALESARDTLVRRAPGLRVLTLGGLRFAESGKETAFGRYLEGRLGDLLVEAYENPLTGRSILLRQTDLAESGGFRLTGTYWDFGEVIELRLRLADGAGVAALWRGQIRTASLPAKLDNRPGGLVAKSPAPAQRGYRVPQGPSVALVRRAQRDLLALGYRPGPIDGVLGPRTEAAIKAYQRRHGLPADGKVTKALVTQLDESRQFAEAQRPEAPLTNGHAKAATPVVVSSTANPAPRTIQPSGGRYCREYAKTVTIGGRSQPSYGTVCQQPDGSWTFAER